MYFDDIVKQAKSPIQQVFADKDEEMFVSIFKAEGDDNDTGESLENPDDGGASGEGPDASGANNEETGESLENPDANGNPNGGDNSNDNSTGESLENPGEGNQNDGSGDANQAGDQDNQAGESLENPNAAQPQQDPNQQQQNPEDEAEKKIKDINERILLFRKHRKLEDTVQILYQSVSSAIGQVVTADNRIKLIRIQKDLLITRGQLEYAITLDFKTINMERAEETYKVLEKKVALMSETIKKIRKDNEEA